MSYHNVFPVFAATPDLSIDRLTADKIIFSTVPQDILQNPAKYGLKGAAHRVYVYMLTTWNYKNPNREGEEAQWTLIKAAICKSLGVGLSTVNRALALLKKLGLATWTKLTNGSTVWEFLLPADLVAESANLPKRQNDNDQNRDDQNSTLYNINNFTIDKKSNNGEVVFFGESFEKEGFEKIEVPIEVKLPCEMERLPKSIQTEIKNTVANESLEIQSLVLGHLAKALLSKTSPVKNPVGLTKSFVTKAKDGALAALFVPGVIDDKENEIKRREAGLNALRVQFNNLRNNLANLRNLNVLAKNPAIEAQIEKVKQDLKAFVLENPDVRGFAWFM